MEASDPNDPNGQGSIGPDGAAMVPLGVGSNGANGHANGHVEQDALPSFEPVPSGSLAPPPPEPMQNARLDPGYAQSLLGPVPGAPQRRELHTNLGDDEPRKPAKTDAKTGRNELCPCGSGKKFKRCHGVTA